MSNVIAFAIAKKNSKCESQNFRYHFLIEIYIYGA